MKKALKELAAVIAATCVSLWPVLALAQEPSRRGGGIKYTSAGGSSSGTGDVVGPASSTDNAVARFDALTGKLLQNSAVTLSDTGIFVANQGGVDLSSVQLPSIGDSVGSRYLTVNTGSGVTQVSSYGLGLVANINSSTGSPVVLWKSPATAVWRAEGASSALGYVMSGVPVESVSATTKSPTVAESGECYAIAGGAGSTINLPNDPTIGSQVCVLLTVSQTVTVAPAAGETISDAGTAYSTSCVADALGESITLVAATGGSGATWVPKSKVGTWTCSWMFPFFLFGRRRRKRCKECDSVPRRLWRA